MLTVEQIETEIKDLNDKDYFAYWYKNYRKPEFFTLLESKPILYKEVEERILKIRRDYGREELWDYAEKKA